ncbi:putative MFS transporter [Aspergillus aculeatinus CBS 121060]|uniref:MFS transporter n=1 Tax=Aspergillus aculeatinus CBS 121060 TaxID=1448322 RepID=A0ACD1H2X1_9EURO|nr:putative MFS transporter [Aspergillus aculeatinus CBS 121060]RAH67913.1 putative MFS transporter [Aspergillus aculeatinus CBS 121060]
MIDLSQEQPASVEPPEPSIADKRWLYAKILSAGFSFFVAGVNDGSLGSLVPYVIRSYHVSTNLVVVVYVSTFAGWLLAAVTNSALCQYLGLGAILALGAALQVLSHALRAWLPPFSLYVVTFFLASLGQAYNDTHANTYVASVNAAHRWLGFIHAMYMAGCLVGPLVATAVASAGTTSQWNLFYLAPLGLGVLNLAFVLTAFHNQLAIKSATSDPSPQGLRDDPHSHPHSKSHRALVEIKNTLRVPTVWLASLYFFFFLGAAITAGGWMVEYLVKVRHGNLDAMGYVPTGFYGGAFLGRLLLAEPTFRLGERRMIFLYAVICVGLQLVFWLVPNIIVEAVAICVLGFFSGPFFAAGISVASKIFPPDVRSSAIAFVFVFGQIGGSLFPVLTGILSARTGVKVLQPMLVALLCATAISWLLLPKPPKPRD